MAFSTENNSRFSKSFSKVAARLMLGLSASLIFFPTKKVLSEAEIMSNRLLLPISLSECKARVTEAGTIAFTIKDAKENEWSFRALGNTAASAVVVDCIERPDGTVGVVTVSSDGVFSDMETLYRRIWQFMTGRF